jgi:proline dehydrogenase
MTDALPDFENTEIAFKHLSDSDLLRAWTLFRAINVKPLVSVGPPLVTLSLKLRLPVKGLLKSTIFNHFCGGETLESCSDTMARLAKSKVSSILDYGIEGEKTEHGFDAAENELLRTVAFTAKNPNVPFCVFKMTALARFGLLEDLSGQLMRHQTPTTSDESLRVLRRVESICSAAVASGKLVMIDAEETWIQPAIDQIALEMMRKHNRDQCRVYTTIQMYRSDGLTLVKNLIHTAQSEGWKCGIKLVRGAYMEKERERAGKHGYPSPIHPDKDATDNAYNAALDMILRSPNSSLCAGTHNTQSSRLALELARSSGLAPKDPKVWFAQLLGMSDDLTFNIANSGYNAAKYVPYGPVDAVLPYLFRRARENTSIAGQSGRELLLIEKEIRRRRH